LLESYAVKDSVTSVNRIQISCSGKNMRFYAVNDIDR